MLRVALDPPEDPQRPVDLRWVQDLQTRQPVVRFESFTLRIELKCVPVAALPAQRPEIVGHCR